MKSSKFFLIAVLLTASVLLSACGALPTDSWPAASVSSDTVYVAYTNYIQAVRLSDGNFLWRYPETGDTRTFFSKPAVTPSLVVAGDYQNSMFGIDPQNKGAEKWKFDGATGRYVGNPIIVNDIIAAPNGDGTLYGLSLDGKLQWKFTAKKSLWASPVSDGKVIYQPSLDHFLYAIDAANGQKLWELDLGSSLVVEPLLDNGILYIPTLNTELVAVDTQTHKEVWAKRFVPSASIWATPAIHEGMLFFGDRDGKLYRVSAKDGSQQWSTDAASPVIGQAAIITNGVVFGTEDGRLLAYSFIGEKLWPSDPKYSGKLDSPLIVTADRIIVAVHQGDRVLVGLDFDGKEKWTYVPPK